MELARRLPRRFYELYGLTEGFVTILDRDATATKLGSVGTPPPGYELCILDEDGSELPSGQVGEIVGRGPITMPGYYKRPDLTAAAMKGGWLYTGDLGYVDADGFLFLVDRKKDLIVSGGVNVYPRTSRRSSFDIQLLPMWRCSAPRTNGGARHQSPPWCCGPA